MWRFSSGGASVVLEDYAPVLLTTWYGTADLTLIDQVFDQLETIYDAATVRIRVGISNVVELPAMPRASERRRMAERFERMATRKANDQLNFVVMQSSIARAGLTAVQWLARTTNRAEACTSMEDAFRRARRALEVMGVQWPSTLDPETYEVPGPGAASATG